MYTDIDITTTTDLEGRPIPDRVRGYAIPFVQQLVGLILDSKSDRQLANYIYYSIKKEREN
jgi:hypothetical protein